LQFRVYGLSFRIWLDVVLRTGEGEEKKKHTEDGPLRRYGVYVFWGGGEGKMKNILRREIAEIWLDVLQHFHITLLCACVRGWRTGGGVRVGGGLGSVGLSLFLSERRRNQEKERRAREREGAKESEREREGGRELERGRAGK
jgi:hypothetical protein